MAYLILAVAFAIFSAVAYFFIVGINNAHLDARERIAEIEVKEAQAELVREEAENERLGLRSRPSVSQRN